MFYKIILTHIIFPEVFCITATRE